MDKRPPPPLPPPSGVASATVPFGLGRLTTVKFVDDALAKIQDQVNNSRQSLGEDGLDLVDLGAKIPETIRDEAEELARDRGLNAAAVVATLGVALRGDGTNPESNAQARPFVEAAAESQDAMAANTLGLILEHQDPGRALRSFEQSAEAGDAQGQYNLGRLLYENGRHSDAQRWLQRSTDPLAGELLDRMKAEGRS